MTILLNSLSLPEDLIWEDEFAFDGVAQAQTRTEGGALIVEETALVAGRPITLVGGADAGWITRAQLIALHALASTAGAVHSLTLNDSRVFSVMFARPAIEAAPIVPFNVPAPGDYYAITLKFFTV